MPKFTTISPTHIEGKKQYAWDRFRQGGYVAIGWLQHVNLTGKSIDEIIEIIRSEQHDNETRPIEAFRRFLSLDPGDYVAVNNTNHGLFGVGIIESGYKFQALKHDSGAEDHEQFYSHYRMVKWLNTTYSPRTALVSEGETAWQPYGTVGKVHSELPPYIARILELPSQIKSKGIAIIHPAFLESVIKAIETLQSQQAHAERAHESLVEEFLVALGYRKHEDIKYRQGRVDIALKKDGHTILVVEVKSDWDLSRYNGTSAIKQAYGYAQTRVCRMYWFTKWRHLHPL
jgi:Holliday junction resolvase-like predicted endonuclease